MEKPRGVLEIGIEDDAAAVTRNPKLALILIQMFYLFIKLVRD